MKWSHQGNFFKKYPINIFRIEVEVEMETDLNEPINEVEEEIGGTTDTSPTKKCCNKVCCCGSMYVLF